MKQFSLVRFIGATKVKSVNTSQSLRYFELLALAALALGVILAGLQYNALASSPIAAALGGFEGLLLVQVFFYFFSRHLFC